MHSTCPPAAARCRGVAPSTPDLASGLAPYSAYSASTISRRPLRHAWWSIVSPAASVDSSTSSVVRLDFRVVQRAPDHRKLPVRREVVHRRGGVELYDRRRARLALAHVPRGEPLFV